jgi:hypothetical protein
MYMCFEASVVETKKRLKHMYGLCVCVCLCMYMCFEVSVVETKKRLKHRYFLYVCVCLCMYVHAGICFEASVL